MAGLHPAIRVFAHDGFMAVAAWPVRVIIRQGRGRAANDRALVDRNDPRWPIATTHRPERVRRAYRLRDGKARRDFSRARQNVSKECEKGL